MHTQDNEVVVQFGNTTSAATRVEKNKDTSGGASESLRIRRGMSLPTDYPKVRVVGGSMWVVAWHSNLRIVFEELRRPPCDENSIRSIIANL